MIKKSSRASKVISGTMTATDDAGVSYTGTFQMAGEEVALSPTLPVVTAADFTIPAQTAFDQFIGKLVPGSPLNPPKPVEP